MKALVYKGINHISLEDVPKPVLKHPTDCIVKIVKTTICGTDLHIKRGDVPSVESGRVLGHEGIGVIEEVGKGVNNFKAGDKVLISCITSCGRCAFCKKQMYSHCEQGGWLLGNKIDGTQAEYVRIPFADTSLHPTPPGAEEEALVLFSDVLPTGFETGVLKGKINLGDVVAIIGAGPIGLATLLTAQFYSPSMLIVIDKEESRLEVAKRLGATHTILANEQVVDGIMRLTERKGVEVAIEAVGLPESFEVCQSIIAVGGTIANIGVHGRSVSLHLEKLWDQNITLTTNLVDTYSIPLLLKMFMTGKLKLSGLITHHFMLNEILKAYAIFEKANQERALKVLIENR
ncbi:zinc-dependent alcohol dehydrogenase family protein [Candidatus Protochlamydia phocaeensis]|uniref:zinc-dependent alcohol dehydrogenase family protein n=1 Tax=Candidatus Protochlamydia phocaeensis TaxID=1414722 RepID=UPI0008382341|nr:zinc-dependent alcohol dehydrogenase family protein [Candidatus Protochlamydia phocaeensis]